VMRHGILKQVTVGALAGLSGTLVMTMVMRRLYQELPTTLRYPLPPREITEKIVRDGPEQDLRMLTLLCHFGYGAAAGALFTLISPRRGCIAGMTYGVGVWVAPLARNLVMINAHLAWGGFTALAAQELERAEREIFSSRARARSDTVPPRAKLDILRKSSKRVRKKGKLGKS
jgi:hypothetical protein